MTIRPAGFNLHQGLMQLAKEITKVNSTAPPLKLLLLKELTLLLSVEVWLKVTTWLLQLKTTAKKGGMHFRFELNNFKILCINPTEGLWIDNPVSFQQCDLTFVNTSLSQQLLTFWINVIGNFKRWSFTEYCLLLTANYSAHDNLLNWWVRRIGTSEAVV